MNGEKEENRDGSPLMVIELKNKNVEQGQMDRIEWFMRGILGEELEVRWNV